MRQEMRQWRAVILELAQSWEIAKTYPKQKRKNGNPGHTPTKLCFHLFAQILKKEFGKSKNK